MLKEYDRAIAFDRKATFSIITHQAHGRCCSETFASNLSDRLNDLMPDDAFAPDDGGLFTDTANYVDDIAECTNVSCGYYNEHTERELLDVAFLVRLTKACIQLDWENLPVVRTPGEREEGKWPFGDDWGGRYLDPHAKHEPVTLEEYLAMSEDELDGMCWDSPESAVELLMELKQYFNEVEVEVKVSSN
jgi:hypothetical protein